MTRREGFIGSVEFNTDLFDAPTIERFAKQYVQTLEFLDRSSGTVVIRVVAAHRCGARASRGVESGAVGSSSECVDIPCRHEPSAIHGAFEAQVRATPDALALVAGHERLTYAELNARANRLAHYLRSQARAPKSRVGLSINDFRSSDRGRARRTEGRSGVCAPRAVVATNAAGGHARRRGRLDRDRLTAWRSVEYRGL